MAHIFGVPANQFRPNYGAFKIQSSTTPLATSVLVKLRTGQISSHRTCQGFLVVCETGKKHTDLFYRRSFFLMRKSFGFFVSAKGDESFLAKKHRARFRKISHKVLLGEIFFLVNTKKIHAAVVVTSKHLKLQFCKDLWNPESQPSKFDAFQKYSTPYP